MKPELIHIRKAKQQDIPSIWTILQQAIRRRKEEGSTQWQGGYPNLDTVKNDVGKGYAYVLAQSDEIIASAALIFNDEPTYESIDGAWLTTGEFMVVHRVAVSDAHLGKGIATRFLEMMENIAIENQVFSIKIDTNFDNFAMVKILDKLNYTYCGEIQVYDGPRKAFEKVLSK